MVLARKKVEATHYYTHPSALSALKSEVLQISQIIDCRFWITTATARNSRAYDTASGADRWQEYGRGCRLPLQPQ